MIPKIRVFAKAGVKSVFGGGYDRDQMFYEISEIDFYNKTVTVWGCHNKDCGMCDDTYNFDDVEILMSTGLKDKNGVEIYEGDIIEHQHVGCQRGVVKMVDGCWVIDDKNKGVNFEELAFEIEAGMGIVIGSIYENPELLEVSE